MLREAGFIEVTAEDRTDQVGSFVRQYLQGHEYAIGVRQFETMVVLCTVPRSSAEGVKCCRDRQERIHSGLLRSTCASLSPIFFSFIPNKSSLGFDHLLNTFVFLFLSIICIFGRMTTMR